MQLFNDRLRKILFLFHHTHIRYIAGYGFIYKDDQLIGLSYPFSFFSNINNLQSWYPEGFTAFSVSAHCRKDTS
ncbi:hypothetical protein D9M68_872490 [compost metagenome]